MRSDVEREEEGVWGLDVRVETGEDLKESYRPANEKRIAGCG